MTPEQERRIRMGITTEDKFIRRGDSVESMNRDIRIYEAHIGILLTEIDSLRLKLAEMEKERDLAKDDLLFYDDACRYCLNPEIEDAWRHDHQGDGRFHWHHRLADGDPAKDCAHSEMYERVWDEAQQAAEARVQRMTEAIVTAREIAHRALLESFQPSFVAKIEQVLKEALAAEGGGGE